MSVSQREQGDTLPTHYSALAPLEREQQPVIGQYDGGRSDCDFTRWTPDTRMPDLAASYVENKAPRASANPPASGGGTGPDLRPAPASPLINTPANYHPFPEWRNP